MEGAMEMIHCVEQLCVSAVTAYHISGSVMENASQYRNPAMEGAMEMIHSHAVQDVSILVPYHITGNVMENVSHYSTPVMVNVHQTFGCVTRMEVHNVYSRTWHVMGNVLII